MNSNEISESSNGEASPFGESSKAEIFFSGVGRLTLLNNIRKDICDCIPVVVLTGAPGLGKSMVGRVLSEGGFTDCHVIYLSKTVESFEDVVRVIAEKVGVTVEDYSRAGISSAMERIAAGVAGYGQRLVLICDGAEQIYLATLERIRKMLDRLNATGVFMQVLFIGNPALLENLKQLSICNFAEVPEKRYELKPLTLSETTTYIDSCLKSLTSEEREVFTPEIVDRIFQNSAGNLKRINALAEEVRKRHSHDASFWVLLENVESGKPPSGRIKRPKWLNSQTLQKIKKPKVLIAGSVLAFGAILLMFIAGRDQGQSSLNVSQGEGQKLSKEHIIENSGAPGSDEPRENHDERASVEADKNAENQVVEIENNLVAVNVAADIASTTASANGDMETSAISVMSEEIAEEDVSVEVDQNATNPAEIVAEEIVQKEAVDSDAVHASAESVAGVVEVPEESIEADIEPASQQVVEVLSEDSVEKNPSETVVITIDDALENLSSPAEADDAEFPVVVKTVEPDPVVIPVLSPTISKKIILSPTEKKEIDEKVEKSNIVISSLSQNEEHNIPVIIGGEENKRLAVQIAERAGAVSKPSAQEVVKLISGLQVKTAEPVQTERTGSEMKKIPVVGAAIIPEASTAARSDMYAKRVAAGSSWLSGKKDKKYTIQLMVLSSDSADASVGKILQQEQYSKEAGQLYIFEKSTAPQAVFVFLGEYNSMTEAREARNNIPAIFQKHKPYVLSVQGAMQKVK